MNISSQAKKIVADINKPATKLGDLRKIAKEIVRNHELAIELWSAKEFFPRMLAILIMDKKLLTNDFIDILVSDIEKHSYEEKIQLADWLMANQLTKDKKLIDLIESWQHNSSSIRRRLFWYHQGRLRWVGQTPPGNTKSLVDDIVKNIATEAPEVQWAMNFTAGWIGVFDKSYRSKCISIGEKTGLFKDEKVSKGCTPNYLPLFISIESAKRKL